MEPQSAKITSGPSRTELIEALHKKTKDYVQFIVDPGKSVVMHVTDLRELGGSPNLFSFSGTVGYFMHVHGTYDTVHKTGFIYST